MEVKEIREQIVAKSEELKGLFTEISEQEGPSTPEH